MKKIEKGTKQSSEGWLDVEETKHLSPTVSVTGVFRGETYASNIGNINRDLLALDGYNVRVTVEVLDTPENRPEGVFHRNKREKTEK